MCSLREDASTKKVFPSPMQPDAVEVWRRDGTALFDKYHKWVNIEFIMDKCLVGHLVGEGDHPDSLKVGSVSVPGLRSLFRNLPLRRTRGG
eukprot:1345855-Rhodomonas_salina.1